MIYLKLLSPSQFQMRVCALSIWSFLILSVLTSSLYTRKEKVLTCFDEGKMRSAQKFSYVDSVNSSP